MRLVYCHGAPLARFLANGRNLPLKCTGGLCFEVPEYSPINTSRVLVFKRA